MFKKFAISFFALFCLCSSTLLAQITTHKAPPKELAGANFDNFIQGETKLQNGKFLKWILLYDTKANKATSMLFQSPEGVTEEEFEPVIQAMTINQFWNGVSNCITGNPSGNAAVGCINALMMTALTDCGRTQKKEDCWMIRTF